MRRVPYLNIILFVLTFLSTLTVGALEEGVNIIKEPLQIYRGFPFAATLLGILLAHELSHYLSSRKHRVDATLPYFIPAPTLFGTFGAFIKMKSPIATRNALMDIGASGPIAGFVLSVVATVVGLFFSGIAPAGSAGGIKLGDSLLFAGLSKLIVGSVPANYDVVLSPVAFAGWIGFFVTSLNLIPVGQLDGGHIVYALLGERHAKLSKILIGVLVLLGFFVWEGWMVWAVLLIILGFRHPPIMYSTIPLDPKRRLIGWAALAIFVLTFTPVPVMIV
ncbi:MAG: site-2 protease family protein [Candidatus Sulfobium sp.]|jgi:membrane-associated protease RseP (regulator of RpoE activity)